MTNRRAILSQEISERTGITEDIIAALVELFYSRVRTDPVLAPVFSRVHDWDVHISHLREFWSSVALMSGRYHGHPMQVHLVLQLEPAHFDRWLQLFEQTADETCPPAASKIFREKARRISDSLRQQSRRSAAR